MSTTKLKHPKIYQYVSSLAEIDSTNWEKFESSFTSVTAQKSQVLLKPNIIFDNIFFVLEGLVRNYYIDEKGREYTKTFRSPGELIGPYAEILTSNPSRYYIQAVTNAKLLQIPYDDYSKILSSDIEWQKFGRIMAEQNYVEKEWREHMLLHMDIAQKYDAFLSKYQQFEEQIPQYQIASYLGVTPEAFNRFKKKHK